MLSRTIDAYIMREIGREGPPPSKFFTAELKDAAALHYPPLPDAADDADDDESSDVAESDDA